MAEADSEDLSGPQTNEDWMEIWQMNRIAIEMKRGVLKRPEAIKQFAYWSQMPETIAWMLLQPMTKTPHDELMRAFPKWITKDKEPKFDDPSKATRAGNLAKRQVSGVDAVGRPSSALESRRRRAQRSAD